MIWKELEKSPNQTLKQHFQNLITMLAQQPSKFRKVHSNLSVVQGAPTEKQRAVLGTAYQSKDKIVVGDYPEELQESNLELTFVSKEAFSKTKSSMISWDQVRRVLERNSNTLEDLFDIFETPIALNVPSGSNSELLARYLAHFYDNQLVIQDDYFIESEKNEQNFLHYVLPKVNPTCHITLRAGVNENLIEKGLNKQGEYESMTSNQIQVHCIDRRCEKLHDGYFETSKYWLTIPYRLAIFGTRGRTRKCTIHITRK